jgi:hypothetical protein
MTILEKPNKFYTAEVSIFNRDGELIIPPVSRVSGIQVMLWMQVQRWLMGLMLWDWLLVLFGRAHMYRL